MVGVNEGVFVTLIILRYKLISTHTKNSCNLN
jgi:hypothetical protein